MYTTLAFAIALGLTSQPAKAADAPAASGFRADYVALLDRAENELTSLEQAFPDKKLSWRPAKGVRSVAEVYLHASGAVYFLLGKAGKEAPADVKALMESKKWESQTLSKAALKDVLTKAVAFLRDAFNAASDADLEKKVDFFGNEVTTRRIYMMALDHFSEHLGQSIAYARMNGVTPPWSKGDK